ncbi:unnamed protein product [Lupinus luteus]|uniref:Uncharacterized protein n=1 Tax=Lupinus luteus TaxID=3873 RepID=A0AAV1VWS2_LUPLU
MEREHQKTPLNSPLIQNLEQDGSIVDVEKSKSSAIGRTEILEEVRKQLWLAGPLIIVNLLNFSLQVISVMFVGHLGELALSGTSMANSFTSVTGRYGYNHLDSKFCLITIFRLEMWSFEMVVLLSGLLPNPKLETSVLSICTRVSNELGAGHPRAARLAVCVVMVSHV